MKHMHIKWHKKGTSFWIRRLIHMSILWLGATGIKRGARYSVNSKYLDTDWIPSNYQCNYQFMAVPLYCMPYHLWLASPITFCPFPSFPAGRRTGCDQQEDQVEILGLSDETGNCEMHTNPRLYTKTYWAKISRCRYWCFLLSWYIIYILLQD